MTVRQAPSCVGKDRPLHPFKAHAESQGDPGGKGLPLSLGGALGTGPWSPPCTLLGWPGSVQALGTWAITSLVGGKPGRISHLPTTSVKQELHPDLLCAQGGGLVGWLGDTHTTHHTVSEGCTKEGRVVGRRGSPMTDKTLPLIAQTPAHAQKE